MFNYVVGLNDAKSFLVAYSNYETVQKNVERRLSQQMVRNDTFFVTLFDCFGPLFDRTAEVSTGFGTFWKENEVKISFDLRQ